MIKCGFGQAQPPVSLQAQPPVSPEALNFLTAVTFFATFDK